MFRTSWVDKRVSPERTQPLIHQTVHTDACTTYKTVFTTVLLRMNLRVWKTCRRQQKLNINLENCAFRWFVLYNYIIMHGAKKKHAILWVKRDQLDVICFIISLFNAKHFSDVNTSILRSLRLMCWVIAWVVLIWFDVCWCYVVVWLWWCGIRMQVEALPSTVHILWLWCCMDISAWSVSLALYSAP